MAFSTDFGCPGSAYLDLIQTGAHEHQLPLTYIDMISELANNEVV